MRAPVIGALSALALLGAAAPSVAQPPPLRDEQVVVVGAAPTREAVRLFVEEMAIASRTTDQLARWDRKLCPGIAGLRTQYARFVIDRMAQRAFDVGLDVGRPGCRANVLIVVTPDPDAIANELATQHQAAMGLLRVRGRTSLGRTAVRGFVDSDAPVRWWHVNRTHLRDGGPVGETMGIPRGGPTDAGAPVVHISGNLSRLQRTTRQDFAAAFIIVNANTLSDIGFNWEALADYLAMVTLAQLDPAADTSGYPTILNMFAERHAESTRAMTDWDVAYLRGLYDTTRNARSVNEQESEIARSMGRTLNPPTARN